MQNCGIPYGMIRKVREADTIILHLHSEFCIYK